MTVENPGLWLENRTDHHAEQYRQMLEDFGLDSEGVMSHSDLDVTQNGTPNMSVNVAAGGVVIHGTEDANQGAYFLYNDAAVNLAIAAADATNPRKDIVIARVKDQAYSGATNAMSIEVVTGTPAASPSEPNLPANSYKLATIDVAAGASSITNANITERRVLHPVVAAPRGVLGYAEVTADQSGIGTTIADLTSLSVAVTVSANRRIRLTGRGVFQKDATAQSVIGYFREGSTQLGQFFRDELSGSGTVGHEGSRVLNGPSSGSHTYKLSAKTNGTNATLKADSGAEFGPAFILVEDIGGVAIT